MKISIIYSNYLKYLVWFIFLYSIVLIVTYYDYKHTKESYDVNKYYELENKLKSIIEEFNLNSECMLRNLQYNKTIVELLLRANTQDSTTAKSIRRQIVTELKKLDLKFKEKGIQTLNIIRANRTVFLRYFEPDLYNDTLDYRIIIDRTILNAQPQDGFSASNYNYSYRKVFPIFEGDNLAVIIEFGLSENFIAKSFSFDMSRLTLLQYYFEKHETKIPKNLIPSPIGNDLYVSKTLDYLKEGGFTTQLFDILKEWNNNNKSYLKNQFVKKNKFSVHIQNFTEVYSFYFIPIYADKDNFAGFLVHGFKNITVESKLFDTIVINVASAAFLVIFLFIIAYRKINIERLEQKIKELQIEKNKSVSLIEQLNRSQEELKEKAEFATKINNLLHEQDILLRKSLDEKNRFFSILAHDIKNPITSLYTNAELLTLYYDKMDENEKKEIIDRLFSVSKILDRLVRDLLEWGKLQLGQYNMELKEIQLKDEVDKIIEIYSESANEKGNKIENKIPQDIKITSDLHIIRTIFRNLFQNSIKFSENGTISIEVLEISSNNITIVIRDTGVGIPQERIQDLFRVDKAFSTKGTRNEEGTGLGLILVSDYIKKIEGSISVESKIGVGTSFFISLPK